MTDDPILLTCQYLDAHGIPYDCLRHPAAFTMEECAAVESRIGAPVCKNLFLCNRQQTQFYLLMLPGDKVFKTKYLSVQLGCARLSFADESHMVDLLGIHPGAVSPMGLINDTAHKVLLVVDRDLLDTDYLGVHPCVNTATLRLSLRDLLSKFVPATGHTFQIVDLNPAGPWE
jgi:Ala-tRNA(Pro) deacylase